jgi:hypothetical protein
LLDLVTGQPQNDRYGLYDLHDAFFWALLVFVAALAGVQLIGYGWKRQTDVDYTAAKAQQAAHAGRTVQSAETVKVESPQPAGSPGQSPRPRPGRLRWRRIRGHPRPAGSTDDLPQLNKAIVWRAFADLGCCENPPGSNRSDGSMTM